jgi:hypothetical protein
LEHGTASHLFRVTGTVGAAELGYAVEVAIEALDQTSHRIQPVINVKTEQTFELRGSGCGKRRYGAEQQHNAGCSQTSKFAKFHCPLHMNCFHLSFLS